MKLSRASLACVLLLSFAAFSDEDIQNDKEVPSSSDYVFGSDKLDDTNVELTPDVVELIVELDPKAYGFRARHHKMQLTADVDWLIRGRAQVQYEYRFGQFWSLVVPVSIDASETVSLVDHMRRHGGEKLDSVFGVAGGVGIKFRLTEWMLKGSFFVEPQIQVGYAKLTVPALDDVTSVRLRPALFVGFERVYDTGFVIHSKLGFEWAYDFFMQDKNIPSTGILQPVLLTGVGYAW